MLVRYAQPHADKQQACLVLCRLFCPRFAFPKQCPLDEASVTVDPGQGLAVITGTRVKEELTLASELGSDLHRLLWLGVNQLGHV